MTRLLHWGELVAVSAVLFSGGCLPDNFWADKWGEIINRSIFGAINAVLTGGLGAI